MRAFAIDLDDVTADMKKAVMERWPDKGEPDVWDFHVGWGVTEEFKSHIRDPWFMLNLSPIHAAVRELTLLSETGAPIEFFTHRHEDVRDVTELWLVNHMPFTNWTLRLADSVPKEGGDYVAFVDDNPDNVLSMARYAGQSILWTQPWNVDADMCLPNTHRFASWHTLGQYLRNLAETEAAK